MKKDDRPHQIFFCRDCKHKTTVVGQFEFNTESDPTNSKGCCRNCGSDNWVMSGYNPYDGRYYES